MAEAHLDCPGDVRWYPRKGPLPVVGPCPHSCSHNSRSVIAWGPDYEHYVLVACDVPDGCDQRCRAWQAEYPFPFSEARPKCRTGPFLMTAEPAVTSAGTPTCAQCGRTDHTPDHHRGETP